MSIADFPQIKALTDEQKLELAQELTASLPEKDQFALVNEIFERFPPPGESIADEKLHQLLTERDAYAEAHPEELLTVDEFMAFAARQRACSKSES